MTKKLTSPFGSQSSNVNDIPTTTTEKGKASYEQGFPAETMLPLDNGGIAPDGKDMNGILKDISANIVDINQGLAIQQYDDTYSQNIGGYPIGARVTLSDNATVVISTIANNQNNPNSNMTGWTLITDAMMQTWAGRTQRDKNKELISVQDYGAKGDGVTDDTQAFIALESEVQGRELDLLNKTYYVANIFNGNKYKNGYFVYPSNGNLYYQNAEDCITRHHAYKSNSDNGFLFKSLLADTDSNSRVYQSFAQDVISNSVWALRDNDTDGNVVLDRYLLASNSQNLSKLSSSKSTGEIGHQGLAIQISRNSGMYFWATAGINYSKDARIFIKFQLDSGGNLTNQVNLKLLDDSYSAINDTKVVTLAPNNSVLAVFGVKAGVRRIRIFDLKTFDYASTGDYSNNYLYDFPLSRPYGWTFADIATDGNFVYVLCSNSVDTTDASVIAKATQQVQVYTLDGKLVCNDIFCRIGLSTAISQGALSNDKTYKYEPESIGFLNINGAYRLTVMSCSSVDATGAYRYNNLHCIHDFQSAYISATELQATTARASNYYADTAYRLVGTVRSGNFQTTGAGSLGIWDTTNSKWVMYSNTKGTTVYFPDQTLDAAKATLKNINLSNLSVYADNSSAKTGGLVTGDAYRTSTGQLMIVY